jgi:hypothetical protein
MADYYLAPSLVALRNEINKRWPNRDKASDGWIGDASHQARKSDHNPDYSAGGVVRAIDVDKDGIDVQQLLDATVRDHRVAYVIWNRRIASATDDGAPWDWEPYDGTNPHDKHIHISIRHTRAAETDTSTWFTPPKGTSMSLTPDQATQVAKAGWLADQFAQGAQFEEQLDVMQSDGQMLLANLNELRGVVDAIKAKVDIL